MSEEQAEYGVNYSGYYDHKGLGDGIKYKWVGYYEKGMKVYVEAISEAEAGKKMKEKFVDKIMAEEDPFCVFNTWEVVDE